MWKAQLYQEKGSLSLTTNSKRGKKAKGRGYRFEKRLEKIGNKLNLDTQFKRQILSGSVPDMKLDVVLYRDGKIIGRIEAKERQDGAGFKRLYRWLEDCDLIKFHHYYAMYYEDYLRIKYGEGKLSGAKECQSGFGFKMIDDWFFKAKDEGSLGLVVGMLRVSPIIIIDEDEYRRISIGNKRNRREVPEVQATAEKPSE